MTTYTESIEKMASDTREKETENIGEESNNGNVDNIEEIARESDEDVEDVDDEEEDEGDSEGEVNEEVELEEPKVETEKTPDQDEVKAEPMVLNLNSEVVNMRKEVRRVRAILSRKIIRQIAVLKKKKGTEVVVEKNQRRVDRLLEELHAMKVLRPDLVTKTALQKTLNFNEVCKNPKSTMSDRAVARIASHPEFKKKIEDIQAAVKAFRDERRKAGKQRGQKEKGAKTQRPPDDKAKKVEQKKKPKEENISKEVEKTTNDDGKNSKDEVSTSEAEDKMVKTVAVETNIVKPVPLKKSEPRKRAIKKPQGKTQENKPKVAQATAQEHKPKMAAEPTKQEEEESDLELSDDEDKPYFDDSTEERFHKQSSQEESDSDNDFFVGKVSKFKKKKSKNTEDKTDEDSAEKSKPADKIQCQLDELETRLKTKTPKLQTVFCSLSQTKPNRGKFLRGQGKPTGRGRVDLDEKTKFRKEEKGPTGKFNRPDSRRSDSEGTNFRGRGRGDARRQQDRHRLHQAPEQALHPSWEASKKRKEQQGQILAYQGKKIKFDDND